MGRISAGCLLMGGVLLLIAVAVPVAWVYMVCAVGGLVLCTIGLFVGWHSA